MLNQNFTVPGIDDEETLEHRSNPAGNLKKGEAKEIKKDIQGTHKEFGGVF